MIANVEYDPMVRRIERSVQVHGVLHLVSRLALLIKVLFTGLRFTGYGHTAVAVKPYSLAYSVQLVTDKRHVAYCT